MSIAKKLNLKHDEEIVEIIRAATITIWWKYFFGLLFVALMSFFFFWLFAQGSWGYVALGLGYFLGVFIIIQTWFFHHFNCLVVTTNRIIDIDRPKISEETISAVSFADVQDIYVTKKGFFANIFNYGSVMIETKSQKFILEIKKVNSPRKLVNWLLEVVNGWRERQRLNNQQAVVNDFLKIISKLPHKELHDIQTRIDEEIQSSTNQEL